MCGILGTTGLNTSLTASLNTLLHRGPDTWGDYFDELNQVYFGHRRLSIIDLSETGRQPMELNEAGLFITYNGEIYNFNLLREQYLANENLNSRTDTEIILRLYKRFGYKTPEFLRGMFAFAVYDRKKQEIFFCRDRLGIKPLYYYQKGEAFAFSSELQALKALPEIDLEIDPVGLDYYFSYGYIPAPFTAYKYIKKLLPGYRAVYNMKNRKIRLSESYWKLRDKIKTDSYKSEEEWIEAIENKIMEAIKLRLISDVPLGAFLSGGIDSSLIVSKMAELMTTPVKTFTIGFDYQQYDERPFAKLVAEKYETEHHTEIVRPDAFSIIDKIAQSFGEPFADSSAIPTYYVSKMAKKYVTVVLSGDGGDEIFAGYQRYKRMYKYLCLKNIPLRFRKVIKHIGSLLPNHIPGTGFFQRQMHGGIELYYQLHHGLIRDDRNKLYSHYFKNKIILEEGKLYQKILDEQDTFSDELITKLQLIDLYSYLPEDILTKVDRMSMLNSLEARVPLLDHELVELSFSCPFNIRFKNKELKYIAKSILKTKVDSMILNHKKTGFAIPLAKWIRKDFNPFFQQMLNQTEDPYGVINNSYVQKLYHSHMRNGRDFSGSLYAVLMYYLWQSTN